MSLLSYLKVLNRRKWIVAITAVMTLVGILIGRALIPQTHTATAVLQVAMFPSGSNASYTQILLIDRMMNTYVKIAASEPLLLELRQMLNLPDDSPDDVKVELVPDTELLRITVSDSDPNIARKFAGELVNMLVENPVQDSRIYVVDPVHLPKASLLQVAAVQIGLALFIGIIAGIGLAFIVDSLDTRLHTLEQITETTRLRVLGETPIARKRKQGKFLIETPPHGDAYRRLAITLLAEIHASSIRTLLITSARPHEGKSTVTANLARTIAQFNRKVIILDADEYHPTVRKFYDLSASKNQPALESGNGRLGEALKKTAFPGVYILENNAGTGPLAAPLQPTDISTLLEEVKRESDLVLIDTPAFLGVADAAMLSTMVDAVLLVVRPGWTRLPELSDTCEQLAHLNPNLIGVVINGARHPLTGAYHKYYRYAPPVNAVEVSPSSQDQEQKTEPPPLVEIETVSTPVVSQSLSQPLGASGQPHKKRRAHDGKASSSTAHPDSDGEPHLSQ